MKKQQREFTTEETSQPSYTSSGTSPLTQAPGERGCDSYEVKNVFSGSKLPALCLASIVEQCGTRDVALNGTMRYSVLKLATKTKERGIMGMFAEWHAWLPCRSQHSMCTVALSRTIATALNERMTRGLEITPIPWSPIRRFHFHPHSSPQNFQAIPAVPTKCSHPIPSPHE